MDFRELDDLLLSYEGDDLNADVLDVYWLPMSLELRRLAAYRRLNTPENAYPVVDTDLWQWFALSVANDFLLLCFQMSKDFYPAPAASRKRQEDEKANESLIRSGLGAIVEQSQCWQGPALKPADYENFFLTLGFQVYETGPFTPFHYEIVEVIEDTEGAGEPVVEHVYWPGLKFGQMLFSRAGARVRCRSGVFVKEIAENSTLYFTNRRHRRQAQDESHGWGHNSRWATRFRRDYETDTHFHYNVEGTKLLYTLADIPSPQSRTDRDGLTPDERIELLTHRCFVQCATDDSDLRPYDDRLSVPKA